MKLRNRQLHPEFFQDEKIASLKPYSRLLFTGLWCIADREGRLYDIPMVIHGLIFPFEPKFKIEIMLSELATSKFIVRYRLEDRCFIWIPKFTIYQKVHPNEAQSVIPEVPNDIKCNYITLQCNVVTKGKGKGIVKDKDSEIPFDKIIDDLNKRAKKDPGYKATAKKNMEPIVTRWNEGYRLKDFLHVNKVKAEKWLGTKYEQFLRPETLYGPKFDGYLNERSDKQIEATEKWSKTAKCPECNNLGPVVGWPQQIPEAKKATGKDPIWEINPTSMQCSKCEHKWNL